MPKYLDYNGTNYLIDKLKAEETDWVDVPREQWSSANLIWDSGYVKYKVYGNLVHWSLQNLRTTGKITYDIGAMILNGLPSITRPKDDTAFYSYIPTIIISAGRIFGGNVSIFKSGDTNNWCIVAYSFDGDGIVPTYGLYCEMLYLI